MKLYEIIAAVERIAKPSFQEEWDNSGLQVGRMSAEVDKVLVCLDVTEEVIDEAVRIGAQLVLSHHPLLFRGLKTVGEGTYQERCVRRAVCSDIAVYSAHTSLDNALGGVNHRIASLIGLENLRWLDSGLSAGNVDHGSGLIGELSQVVDAEEFISMLKERFGVTAVKHGAAEGRSIRTVALCGGAGAFLLPQAVAAGADCFISGEFHYHDYFDPGTLLIELGHYESEQFTQDLLLDILAVSCPGVKAVRTSLNTNPIRWTL